MNISVDHYCKLASQTLQERAKEYGDYRTSFKIMAERFSCNQKEKMSDLDACMLMVELKLARIQANQKNPEDSIKDAIGYLSIYGGLLESKKKSIKQE